MPIGEELDAEVYTTSCGIGGSGHITSWCDSQNDCPSGLFCCARDFGNFNSMVCSPSCPEEELDSTGAGTYLLCRSPGGGTTPCPDGRACTRIHPELLQAWGFCEL
jgi:hypothetical protein